MTQPLTELIDAAVARGVSQTQLFSAFGSVALFIGTGLLLAATLVLYSVYYRVTDVRRMMGT